MSENRTVGMISLGCNKNRVDSEIALGLMREHGWTVTPEPGEAEVLIVNTCGFIGPAKEESIDAILEMADFKRRGRCRLLVVTGCLAQRYGQELLDEMPEIDLLLGVNQYPRLPELVEEALRAPQAVRTPWCADTLGYFEHDRVLTTPGYSAYVRIGEGCSNRCAFCAIPLIRGKYRSRDREAILAEGQALAKQGVREHILVAQDTTRWGTDGGQHSRLHELLRDYAAIPGVDWLRVLYCYPDETSEALLDVIAGTPNICSYLDLPFQHINDDILRRMRRRGDSGDIRRCVRLAKERGLTLRTSLIVGFPGETEAQFQELLDFLAEARIDRVGAFAFSPEEGTPAAEMPDQIPEEVKQERLDRLMKLQNRIAREENEKRVGQTVRVLVTAEPGPTGSAYGRSEAEVPESDGEILFEAKGRIYEGDFVNVRLLSAGAYDMAGVQV